jgi:Mn2+/Fe2+ NRAMP family transporter
MKMKPLSDMRLLLYCCIIGAIVFMVACINSVRSDLDNILFMVIPVSFVLIPFVLERHSFKKK